MSTNAVTVDPVQLRINHIERRLAQGDFTKKSRRLLLDMLKALKALEAVRKGGPHDRSSPGWTE